ncbi:hypothetical protein SNARM312S_06473 [Streptomyces narbonensis]
MFVEGHDHDAAAAGLEVLHDVLDLDHLSGLADPRDDGDRALHQVRVTVCGEPVQRRRRAGGAVHGGRGDDDQLIGEVEHAPHRAVQQTRARVREDDRVLLAEDVDRAPVVLVVERRGDGRVHVVGEDLQTGGRLRGEAADVHVRVQVRDRLHQVADGRPGLAPHTAAEGAGVRVGVDRQDLVLPLGRQGRAQRGRRRGLADTALEGDDRDPVAREDGRPDQLQLPLPLRLLLLAAELEAGRAAGVAARLRLLLVVPQESVGGQLHRRVVAERGARYGPLALIVCHGRGPGGPGPRVDGRLVLVRRYGPGVRVAVPVGGLRLGLCLRRHTRGAAGLLSPRALRHGRCPQRVAVATLRGLRGSAGVREAVAALRGLRGYGAGLRISVRARGLRRYGGGGAGRRGAGRRRGGRARGGRQRRGLGHRLGNRLGTGNRLRGPLLRGRGRGRLERRRQWRQTGSALRRGGRTGRRARRRSGYGSGEGSRSAVGRLSASTPITTPSSPTGRASASSRSTGTECRSRRGPTSPKPKRGFVSRPGRPAAREEREPRREGEAPDGAPEPDGVPKEWDISAHLPAAASRACPAPVPGRAAPGPSVHRAPRAPARAVRRRVPRRCAR